MLKEELKKLKPGESITVNFEKDEESDKEISPAELHSAFSRLEPGESIIVRFNDGQEK